MINALSISDAKARTDAFCFGWLELAFRLQARRPHRTFSIRFRRLHPLKIALTPESYLDPHSRAVTFAGKSLLIAACA